MWGGSGFQHLLRWVLIIQRSEVHVSMQGMCHSQCLAWRALEWDGMEQGRMGWNGRGRSGIGMKQDGMGWDNSSIDVCPESPAPALPCSPAPFRWGAGSSPVVLLQGQGHLPRSSLVTKHLPGSHDVIYSVISLISHSKTDLVSKLHELLYFH